MPLIGGRICSMMPRTIATADYNPKHRRLYRYKPRWVVITTWRFDLSSSFTWKYALGISRLENSWLPDRRSNTSLMWGRIYWVRCKYWLTDTLKSPQIQTWPLGFSTGTIGVVLNSDFFTLLMMLRDSNPSSSGSTLGRKAYGTGRGLNSLKLEFGLMWRWALNLLIRG